ncbi:hypothetical protein D3C81_288480 [compost metagenome]
MGADCHDLTDDHALAPGAAPLEAIHTVYQMQIGAADAAGEDFDQQLIGAGWADFRRSG